MADRWIAVDKTERYNDRSAREDSGKKREQLLKNRLLETRIAATVASTKQREQKLADERERIAADAIEGIATDADERNAAMLEKYHGTVSRFFILGSAGVFAFAIGGLALFLVVILLGIASGL